LTFNIYLNGKDQPIIPEAAGFENGCTNFLNTGKQTQDRVSKQIVPMPGMVLVFDHNMLHEGEKLIGGVKYLMRSDVVYKLQKNK
jgi:hypothetical protein